MAKRIVDLMRIPREMHDLTWLTDSLQAAVQLEISTLPPYLCGLWSIQTADVNGPVYTLVNSVVEEEMLHMGWVCNILNSLQPAQTPEIVKGYQDIVYPGRLPGGVRPELTVTLAGLSKKQVFDVYMEIEHPEKPVALDAVAAGETFPTIGAFYDALLEVLGRLKPTFTGANQLTATFTSNSLTEINTLADAQAALTDIKEQGEGTSTSPISTDPGTEFAHYYRFKEIYEGKTLVQVAGKWEFTGPAIPFPATFSMTAIPKGGYQNPSPAVRTALFNFDTEFSTLLNNLQLAWGTGSSKALRAAVGNMFKLGGLAAILMAIPLPDGSGVYGPDFLYIP